jgi:hypothetical protein
MDVKLHMYVLLPGVTNLHVCRIYAHVIELDTQGDIVLEERVRRIKLVQAQQQV